MMNYEIDLEWTDVDGLIVAGVEPREAHALVVAARSGGRARGAELAAGLQLVVDRQRVRVELPS
ncbi:MAG TPA: hypothetical protein VGM56_20965 [Byssovorax sp.]|jgi:hypothetical protein